MIARLAKTGQCAYVIAKGTLDEIRAAGLPALR